MDRKEILGKTNQEVINDMEAVLADFEQNGKGFNCDLDAVQALQLLRANHFYTDNISSTQIISIPGPLTYYNHKFGKPVYVTRHHTVARILAPTNDWIIDIASKPGHRVYEGGIEGYKANSGIKLTSI